MVRIRLARSGAKNQPFYRIVVSSKRSRRDGGFVDRIGFLNPVAVGGEVPLRIDTERFDYWVSQGAKPSERVLKLAKFYAKHGEGEAAQRSAPPVSKTPETSSQPQPEPVNATESAEGEDASASAEAAADTADASDQEDTSSEATASATGEADTGDDDKPASADSDESGDTGEDKSV